MAQGVILRGRGRGLYEWHWECVTNCLTCQIWQEPKTHHFEPLLFEHLKFFFAKKMVRYGRRIKVMKYKIYEYKLRSKPSVLDFF